MQAPRPFGSVDLYRGLVYAADDVPEDIAGVRPTIGRAWPQVASTSDPMTAWSLSLRIALLFAMGFAIPDVQACPGFIAAIRAPIEKVFSMAFAGMGNAELAEFVLIGREMQIAVVEVEHAH